MDNRANLDNLIDNLVGKEEVVSLGYIGSLAKEYDLVKCRDADILVIVDGHRDFEREIYQLGNLEVDISYITFDELENQIYMKSPIWLKAFKDYRQIYLQNESINKKIEKIKKNIDDFYDKYDKISDLQNLDHIKFLRYDISNKLEYLLRSKNDRLLYRHLESSFVLDLIKLYFEINNMIIPKLKKQISEIKKNDLLLYNMLEEYYTDNQIGGEKFLFMITDYVLKKHGGRLYEFKKGYYPVDR